MSKMIINADDFGYSRSVNYGIVDSHKLGILTSTTIMANMPGFKHAVELSKENPDLGIGVHLTLTAGKPITNISKDFLDSEGNFKRRGYYLGDNDISLECEWLNPAEVYVEWKAQLDKVIESGIKVTHLDSHHHMHTHEKLVEVIKKLSREYNLLVRNYSEDKKFNDQVDYFENYLDNELSSDNPSLEKIKNMIDKASSYEVSEIMCHPAYIDKYILENSSFNIGRIYEVNILTSNEIKRIIKDKNIELINYSNL